MSKQGSFEIEIPKRKREAPPQVPTDSIPYRPSNGTEGDWFIDKYCSNCTKLNKSRGYCSTLAKTEWYDTDSKHYPKWWVSDKDGSNPRCLLYKPAGDRGVKSL